MRRSSPMDLRGGGTLDEPDLVPYQPPRMLVKQDRFDADQITTTTNTLGSVNLNREKLKTSNNSNSNSNSNSNNKDSQETNKRQSTKRRWIPLLSRGGSGSASKSSFKGLKGRLSSLESTQSNGSSMEFELAGSSEQSHMHGSGGGGGGGLVTPLISITNNDGDSTIQRMPTFPRNNNNQRRWGQDFYGGQGHVRAASSYKLTRQNERVVDDDDEEEDNGEDDDVFNDSPLSSPYSLANRSTNATRATLAAPTTMTKKGPTYEEMLDDRQGMNDDSEQQFTKAEKANRYSIDGSIISESRLDDKSRFLGSGGAKSASNTKLDKHNRRSKSPSIRRRHSSAKRTFMSKFKLTKKHESIAKLQLSILNSGFVSLKTLDRDLQSFLPNDRMALKDFQERVKLMRKFEVLSSIEYRFASKYETYVCKHAQQETNHAKNNCKKCIPYDYNRVVLKTLPNVADSDYINASHVDSLLKPNAYIAAQGPNENTLEDFWRMIWEQKTFVIVMLTKVFDFIRVMCNQYWPVEVNKPERYGNVEVTLLYEEPLADFVIRTIKLTRLKSSPGTNQNNNEVTTTATAAATDTAITNQLDKNKTTTTTLETKTLISKVDDAANDSSKLYESGDEADATFGEDDEDDDDDDYFDGDLESEELIISELDGSLQNLTVRSPKYLAATSGGCGSRANKSRLGSVTPRRFRGRSLSPASVGNNHIGAKATKKISLDNGSILKQASAATSNPINLLDGDNRRRSTVISTVSDLKRGSKDTTVSQQQHLNNNNTTTTEQLLHPLFGFQSGSSYHLNSASLSSLPTEPPQTPRTPSSAGIDRSSATRKAVKKKRRERVKNQRPKRTQFMVPTESQLMDDDDDDDDDNCDTGDMRGATAAAETEARANRDGDNEAEGTTTNNEPGTRSSRSNERIIYQFHYNSWASHTCPFISSLLHFRRRVRICMDEMAKSGRTGPTVVHCNDGCGRTGTYLCIDANLELAEEDNLLDVYNYTRKMRQSRKFLIENLEQYKFVYDTIDEALFCGRTWFPVSDLHKRLKHKSQRNPVTKKNEYLLEYEKICQMTSKFSIGDCAGGHRVENREKNRDVSTVPPDNFRPYLTSFQTNDSTDYINAVFVDGYTRSKEYIVTEWPLHRTISDFWSLVYDHDCNSVILLANPLESSTYPSFLPSEKELRRKFGPVFSAEMVSYTHYQNIKSWIYTINKKIVSLTEVIAGVKSEAKTTQVFQITCWPQGHRVPTSTNALVELMNMVERWRQRTTYGPVCVVSLNGKSRAGVYCAANVAIEQVVQHSEVDVFNAVKTVRRHRPQLIENMTEYKYCYDLILHYVLHYVNNPSPSNN